MVKKLLKHELYALFRVLVFFAIAVVVFGALGRIALEVQLRRSGETAFGSGIAWILVMFYVFAIGAFVLAAYALGISRFYKTLFTGEGYMTLSLPVTPMQLILAKLLSSLIAIAFSTVVSALTASLFFVGWGYEVWETIVSVFRFYSDLITYVNGPFFWVEFAIAMVLSLPMWLLIVYSIICVGQMVTSHRKAATFGIFIGLWIAWNFLDNVLLSPMMSRLAVEVSPHLSMWITIVFYAAVDVGCFLLIRYILRNKVNLIA